MTNAKLDRQIVNADDFGRVAVVFGGDSVEREVSLDSGSAVLASLRQQGIDALAFDGIPALCNAISNQRLDRVFNVLHGTDGEDGVLQGLLEACKLPYTGCGVLGSALAMDKIRSKQLWQQLQLPTAEFIALEHGSELTLEQQQNVVQWLPVVIKPNQQGSTVGVTIVRALEQLAEAITQARQYDDSLMIERFIDGEDYTVAFVKEAVLPSIRIRPEQGFYDYQAKYQSAATRYDTGALNDQQEQELLELSLAASKVLDVSGWGRVDVMRDRQANNWLLEVNTVPGMTSHSLVPKAAHAAGYSYDDLTWAILETSLGMDMI